MSEMPVILPPCAERGACFEEKEDRAACQQNSSRPREERQPGSAFLNRALGVPFELAALQENEMKGQRFSKTSSDPRNQVNPADPTEQVPKSSGVRALRWVVQAPAVIMERHVPKEPVPWNNRLSRNTALLILVTLLFALFLGALIIFVECGAPREVEISKKPTEFTDFTPGTEIATVSTRGVVTPCSCDTSDGVKVDGQDEPIVQPVGHDKHEGDLPEDVRPESYDIAMNLTGATLGPAMTVTGRVDAHLTVFQPTDRVVVMAKADTLKDIRVAMLHGAPSSCSKGRGLAVHSVSRDADFLIVRVKNPLLVGHAYTLVTVYTYQLTSGGPIRLTEKLGRMQLEFGKARAAFPCYDKKGFLASMKLTLVVPSNLTPIANAQLDLHDQRTKKYVDGSRAALRQWRFLATVPMPLHKLAWAVLPPTLTAYDIIPLVVRQFSTEEDVEVKTTVERSLTFLSQYFGGMGNLHIPKFDIVLANEEQDSIGLLLLNHSVAIKGTHICNKVANQWMAHLLAHYSQPSWLASSGVEYLCRLAFADNEDDVVAAFQPEIEKCLSNAATPEIKKLLAFRMAHISLGDNLMRKAIQKYVAGNLFKGTTEDDDTLKMFAPVLPKEKIQALFAARFETAKLERSFGQHKKLTWKQPKANPLPVATNAVKGTLMLKTPVGFNVSFLDASKPETQLVLADNEALFANPGVMACYGLELDNRSWALVGQSMETVPPHVLNADYLLSQASKQFKNVTWPHDIAGFLWASVLLKDGDDRRWNKYGKQFVASEYHGYTMLLLTPELDKTYKKRVEEVIKKRVAAIKPATELRAPGEKASLAVALANVACFIGSEKCAEFTAGLEGLVIDGEFVRKVQAATLLAPEAVACRIASEVRDDAAVAAKIKDSPLSMRLAFGACIRHGIGKAALKKIAREGLEKDLDQQGTIGVRLSPYMRDKMLAYILKDEEARFMQEFEGGLAAIERAGKLRVLRSSKETETMPGQWWAIQKYGGMNPSTTQGAVLSHAEDSILVPRNEVSCFHACCSEVASWLLHVPFVIFRPYGLKGLERPVDEYGPLELWVTRKE